MKKAVSAGGVIAKEIDGDVCVLLLKTWENKYFLPKGHVEKGETVEEAAFREVYEEAGIKELEILDLLGTYQRYVEEKDEDKTIHYYLMHHQVDNEEHIIGPDSEGLEFIWHPLEGLIEESFYLHENYHVIEANKKKIKKIIKTKGKK